MNTPKTHIICVGAIYIDTIWMYVPPQLFLLLT
jgi:hypothetical protein